MWAIDFISYYYDKIRATEDDTRTTPYRRLLDCVVKDYDDYADQLTTYDDPSYIVDAAYTEATVDEELEELERINDAAPDRSAGDNGAGNTANAEEEQASEPGQKAAIEDSPTMDMESMTVEQLDAQIAKMKKLLELAELHKQVKKHE